MFFATSALGNSWLISTIQTYLYAVYRFHVYFHVRLIQYHLGISLPHEDGFSKVKSSYFKNDYYSICDDYGVNPDETWMHGNWFYTMDYGIFCHEVKAPGRSPRENLTRWIIAQSTGFTKKSIEKISRSVRAYVYLVLTSQIQPKSTIYEDYS